MASVLRLLPVAVLLVTAAQTVQAQNVAFTPERFPNKEGLKLALRQMKDGEEYLKASPPRYAAALPVFLEAQKLNPNNGALNLRIGECYQNMGDRATALPYLQKAAKLETGPEAPRAHFALGSAYQLSNQWADAIKEFERARPVAVATAKKGQPADASAAEVARRLAQCKTGQRLSEHPTRVFIDNLGPTLNSPEADYNPVVAADETMLWLTSRRSGSLGGQKAASGSGFAEDIYVAKREGQAWGAARNPNTPVNSNGDDAVVALSVDGQRLLLHPDNNPDDLSETRLTANGWSKPKELGSHINTKHHETSATYSPDGKYVYFVSDKPEGSLGGKDIYRAEVEGKNPAQNLGAAINTPYNEESVYLHPDGKTLYFSSQGHSSMGGYDIFKSTFENGKWSEPENLGWPLNTPEDDMGFVLGATGRTGYLASNRPGGLGSQDIYRVTFLGPEKQPLLNQEDRLLSTRPRPLRQPLPPIKVQVITPEVTVLKGTVTEIATRKPVVARLEVYDNASGQLITTTQTSAAGKYLLSLPSGTNYGLVVRHENYLFHSENVNLPPKTGYSETVRELRLQKMEPGANVVLNNIFFEPGKATLRPESTAELERLLKLLSESPKLKLTLCGHTDDAGEAAANQELSQRRAQAVVAYLLEKKVKADRLTAHGYGSTIPIASNATDAGRQLNRRLTFKVVSN